MTAAALLRAYQLAWRPGRWMHVEWWPWLKLAGWRDVYSRHPACRAEIDRLIIARRGFPRAPLPSALDASQQALLALEPRLPALLTALGLIGLDCRDYLLLGDYRRAVSSVLGPHGCGQLLILQSRWGAAAAEVEASALPAHALACGIAWLGEGGGQLLWPLLSSLLPPSAAPVARPGDAWATFRRLARWL
ncbi:type III secretion system domain-containing protein [Paludibacterium yongneupense]|uniref:type III secretion system domain-containing protein n=1 Tax=Paludibacterium yongneupense TaxID=400061 RepID=UPI000411C79B|nr:type III secretion system domain-containing protein [Paludibacterium yongneupense]